MGKRLSLKEINIARHEQEILNSRVGRGEIDLSSSVRTGYVVCGCGAEGCGFITRWMKTQPNVIDLERERESYHRWLENHRQNM